PDITPQLVKINGRNAVISMPGGKTVTVNSGQMLPGGRWQIVRRGYPVHRCAAPAAPYSR
ncbi:hypothetical protein MJL79_28335, partial [Salmonella enterica subsp. enterica serovar Montevideo]|nr:hypothetical protein [Salmonella enterica subsp. enterica serovar Montevideo]